MKNYALMMGLLFVSLILLFSIVLFPSTVGSDMPLLEVSVLIRESDSTTWSNARQGMEQAASDFQVELRFLPLSEGNDLEQQQYTLAREISNGADGIIISPVESDTIAINIETISPNLPVVSLESPLGSSSVAPCISVDNYLLGETLALSILGDVPTGSTVLLVDSSPQSTGISARLDSALTLLQGVDYTLYVCTPTDHQTLEERLSQQVALRNPDAILTFEPTALETCAALIQDQENAPLLYGTGSTDLILSHLEQGDITMVIAQNEFAMGYLAVETLVNAIYSAPPSIITPMDFFLVRQENMYDTDYQKLLFPVA